MEVFNELRLVGEGIIRLLVLLIGLSLFDIATGMFNAWKEKGFRSYKAKEGIASKVMYLSSSIVPALVGLAFTDVAKATFATNAFIVGLIVVEVASIVENLHKYFPKLADRLGLAVAQYTKQNEK